MRKRTIEINGEKLILPEPTIGIVAEHFAKGSLAIAAFATVASDDPMLPADHLRALQDLFGALLSSIPGQEQYDASWLSGNATLADIGAAMAALGYLMMGDHKPGPQMPSP
jgi:hypothetical protein